MTLQPPIVHAPPFPAAPWIHAHRPLHRADLRGAITLIHFWDYTCINCIRSLPYLRAWHQRYRHSGLRLVGIHTPEFDFARHPALVKAAAGKLGIAWPTLVDSDSRAWQAYANRYWPCIYLLDAQGYIRYQQPGEGHYAQTERAIQTLIQALHPELDLPEPISPLRAQDQPGAVCLPATPELHAEALGNPHPQDDQPTAFTLPEQRVEGRYYLEGTWQRTKQGMSLCSQQGSMLLPYKAESVHAVLAPTPDLHNLTAGLFHPVQLTITQQNEPLPTANYGEDLYNADGHATLRVDSARLYTLVRHANNQLHEVRLDVSAPDLTIYAFSFGPCLAAPASAAIEPKE